MTIHTFLDYLKYEKRFSKHTLVAYKKDLEQFTNFLLSTYEQDNISIATHHQIRSWLIHLMDAELNTSSINRKLSSLKAFFRFLQKRGTIERNPMDKVVAPKNAKRLPNYMPIQEIERLFELLDFDTSYVGQRDRLILEILYSTGVRRSELMALTLEDINFQRKEIKILGKGQKERLIPFGTVLQQSLADFIALRKIEFPNSATTHLLLTEKGKPLYPKLVYNVVHKYLSLVSTADRRSPHTLRHSFATHLSENGAELNAIKSLLGHANLAATQIYTTNTIQRLREVYKQAHPKAESE